jgi:hypothetical protein
MARDTSCGVEDGDDTDDGNSSYKGVADDDADADAEADIESAIKTTDPDKAWLKAVAIEPGDKVS